MATRKASLFIIFCLLSLVVLGTVFSRFWRAHKTYQALKSGPPSAAAGSNPSGHS